MSEQQRYEKAIAEAGFEPFEVVTEPWGVYSLADGSYLKMRLNVIKIARQTDASGNIGFNINNNITIGTISPKGLRGTPSARPPTPEELAAAIVEDDVGFSTVSEQWSTYKLVDGTLINAKIVPVKVSRTSVCDPSGEPIYTVSHQFISGLRRVSIPDQ